MRIVTKNSADLISLVKEKVGQSMIAIVCPHIMTAHFYNDALEAIGNLRTLSEARSMSLGMRQMLWKCRIKVLDMDGYVLASETDNPVDGNIFLVGCTDDHLSKILGAPKTDTKH